MTNREQDFRGPHRCSKDDLNLCGLHEYIEEDRKEHRALVCGKIKEVQGGLDNMAKTIVPRWIFSLVMSAAFGFSLILFCWVADSVKEGQAEIKTSLSVIHKRISDKDLEYGSLKDSMMEIKYGLQGVSTRLENVEKKVNNQKP